jgi:hypothetical protein
MQWEATTAAWKIHKKRAFANPCYTIHPMYSCFRRSSIKLTLMSSHCVMMAVHPAKLEDAQAMRWEEKPTELSEEDRDYYLEKVSFF